MRDATEWAWDHPIPNTNARVLGRVNRPRAAARYATAWDYTFGMSRYLAREAWDVPAFASSARAVAVRVIREANGVILDAMVIGRALPVLEVRP